ncbi:MAG: hypothetical protein K0V04_40670 [Deltaproteobacteria bacterium]|nr:hypothetical protein [Deltaproteobacteria bacterium]
MKIRCEQYARLNQAVFEDWLVTHLRRCFPRQCAALSGDQIRVLIREGIARARDFEIIRRVDLCRYLHLMFVLGREFVDDPQQPWIREILTCPRLDDGAVRVEQLRQETTTRLRRMASASLGAGAPS